MNVLFIAISNVDRAEEIQFGPDKVADLSCMNCQQHVGFLLVTDF